MKSRLVILLAIFLLTSAAHAQAPTAKEPVEVTPTATPGKAAANRTTHASATIAAIDVAGRQVTPRGPTGETQTFRVGPEA